MPISQQKPTHGFVLSQPLALWFCDCKPRACSIALCRLTCFLLATPRRRFAAIVDGGNVGVDVVGDMNAFINTLKVDELRPQPMRAFEPVASDTLGDDLYLNAVCLCACAVELAMHFSAL